MQNGGYQFFWEGNAERQKNARPDKYQDGRELPRKTTGYYLEPK